MKRKGSELYIKAEETKSKAVCDPGRKIYIVATAEGIKARRMPPWGTWERWGEVMMMASPLEERDANRVRHILAGPFRDTLDGRKQMEETLPEARKRLAMWDAVGV